MKLICYYLFAILLFLSMMSCSTDSDINNEISNTEMVTKTGEPVPNTSFYTTTELIDYQNNCFKYQVSLWMDYIDTLTNTRNVLLMHSVIMQTGSGCETEGALYYNGDWIIEDLQISGTRITEFWNENPNEYLKYEVERDRMIANVQ